MNRILSFVPRTTAVTKRLLLLLCFFIPLLLIFTHPTHADPPLPSSIIVTNTAIEDVDGNGCSLYEALQAIFMQNASGQPTYTYHQCTAGASPVLITFGGSAAGGVLTYPAPPQSPSQLPMITTNVAILGPVTIDGGGSSHDHHIFWIGPGGILSLAEMTLINGHTSGGGAAILDNNQGTLNILDVSFIGNVAEGSGGAINSNGAVNILASNFSGNKALGVYPDQSDNPSTGFGGAISIEGSDKLKVSLSAFNGNTARQSGGAVFQSSNQAEISDSTFNGNLTTTTNSNNNNGGGAFFNDYNSSLKLIRTTFDGNISLGGNGGGLYSAISASAVITNTSFNGNIVGDQSNAQMGGAIYNMEDLLVTGSFFLNNLSTRGNGGAIANDKAGTVQVVNSTLTANAAPTGLGGGVFNTNTQQGGPSSNVTLTNVTLSSNAAQPSSDHGGGVYNASGHYLTLVNTIIDNSDAVGDNCEGTITSGGHNLDSGTSCGLNGTGDVSSGDPKLDTPGFNGGPLSVLLTQKLLAGSDAMDVGDDAICQGDLVDNKDQRGESRPKDGDGNGSSTCDMGAYESDTLQAGYGSTPLDPGPIVFGSTTVGTPVEKSFTVYETGNTTLTVSNSVFGGPDMADFTAVTAFPFNINDGGNDVQLTLSCTPTAVALRTATLTLTTNDPNHATVTYNLECPGIATPQPGFASSPETPGPLNFGEVVQDGVAYGDQTITLMETGTAGLHVTLVDFSGQNPGDFSIASGLPATIMNGGADSDVVVRCQPTAVGTRTATLNLATDDPSRPTASYNLICRGIPTPPPYLAEPGQTTSGYPNAGTAYGIDISPDGKFVYVANVVGDSVTVFARNADTGDLTFVQSDQSVDLNGVHSLKISPDGKQLYATADGSDSFVIFDRDVSSGIISIKDAYHNNIVVDGLDGAFGLDVSPDGRYIYVSSPVQDSIAIFYRDADDFVGYEDTITSVELDGVQNISITPDGQQLYAVGFPTIGEGQIAAYQRDLTTGALTHIQTKHEGDVIFIFPVTVYLDGLDGAYNITISPDGIFIYVVSAFDDNVALFKRNPTDGTMLYYGHYREGSGTLTGLNGPFGVDVSPDGKHLFVSSLLSDAVAVFERDTETGFLTEIQVVFDDAVGGTPSLDGALSVLMAPDGRGVYATAYSDSAVVSLPVSNPRPILDSLSPSSAPAGTQSLTLAIYGQDFMTTAQAEWNGSPRTTTFINANELYIDLTASDLAAIGTATVSVQNPAPGGGYANDLVFTISDPADNPIPSISQVTPSGVLVGSPGQAVDVTGSNLMATTVVQFNGADRPTTFIDETHVQVMLTTADFALPGEAGLTAVNPAPGGGPSNTLSFTVVRLDETPPPTINAISPNTTIAQGASGANFNLVVTGINFTSSSVVRWNGSDRPTTYVSETQLTAVISPVDVAFAGNSSVTVFTPEPGGGTSNALTFQIYPYGMYLPIGILH